jgi:hypothetical protein
MKLVVVFAITLLSLTVKNPKANACGNNANWWVGRSSPAVFINFPSETLTQFSVSSGAIEGTSTFSAQDGSIWFYIGGTVLYDRRSGSPQIVSSSIPADPSNTNPGLILSMGNNIFYLFTNTAEMNTNRPGTVSLVIFNGSVIPATIISTTALISNTLEGSIIIEGSNKHTFWYCVFVGGADDSASLQSVQFDPSGVLQIVANPPFSWNCPLSSARGVLKYQELTRELLLGIGGRILTYSFDTNTGLISNENLLVNLPGAVGYSAELSPDGTKLYYVNGNFGLTGKIYQYDRISATTTLMTTDLSPSAGMGLADNGKIYIALPTFASGFLGVIQNPNLFGVAAGYSKVALGVNVVGYNVHQNIPCGLSPSCPIDCNDGNSCTMDFCVAESVCEHFDVCATNSRSVSISPSISKSRTLTPSESKTRTSTRTTSESSSLTNSSSGSRTISESLSKTSTGSRSMSISDSQTPSVTDSSSVTRTTSISDSISSSSSDTPSLGSSPSGSTSQSSSRSETPSASGSISETSSISHSTSNSRSSSYSESSSESQSSSGLPFSHTKSITLSVSPSNSILTSQRASTSKSRSSSQSISFSKSGSLSKSFTRSASVTRSKTSSKTTTQSFTLTSSKSNTRSSSTTPDHSKTHSQTTSRTVSPSGEFSVWPTGTSPSRFLFSPSNSASESKSKPRSTPKSESPSISKSDQAIYYLLPEILPPIPESSKTPSNTGVAKQSIRIFISQSPLAKVSLVEVKPSAAVGTVSLPDIYKDYTLTVEIMDDFTDSDRVVSAILDINLYSPQGKHITSLEENIGICIKTIPPESDICLGYLDDETDWQCEDKCLSNSSDNYLW